MGEHWPEMLKPGKGDAKSTGSGLLYLHTKSVLTDE